MPDHEQLPLWVPVPPAPKRWVLIGGTAPHGEPYFQFSKSLAWVASEPIYRPGREFGGRGGVCEREPDEVIALELTLRLENESGDAPYLYHVAAIDGFKTFLREPENAGLLALLRDLVAATDEEN